MKLSAAHLTLAVEPTPLRWSGPPSNMAPVERASIGDVMPIVTRAPDAVELSMTPWAWKAATGKPVFNFRSDGRSFEGSLRCLIPADAFYEFTTPEGWKKGTPKQRWTFTLA
ncbi:MAG TPA: hypothetical protein VGB49_08695, partial [Caulobacteraceae bacterium]